MTVPAAAPASGPIAPAAPRAAPQPPADRFAFAAVLDSLPSAPAKAGGPAAEEQLPSSNELPQDKASRGQTAHHWSLNDSALLASLPFALRAASMMDERPQAADNSPSLPSPAMKASKSEDSGASLAAGAKAATVGRLIGERAFHLGASTFGGVISSRTLAVDAPASASAVGANLAPQADPKGESALAAGFARDEAMPAKPLADAVPPLANANAPAPIAPRAGAHPTNRVSPTRAAAHEAARSGRKPEVSAPPPVARVASSAAPPRQRNRAPMARDRRSPARSDRLRRAVNGANKSVRRTLLRVFRGRVVRPRRLDGGSRGRRRRAARDRARRRLRALRSAGQGDRRRSFAGRPRGRLDDDAAHRRQAFCRHPRSQLSDPGLNRRRARRDRRSNGGDRPAARLAHCQADGRQH